MEKELLKNNLEYFINNIVPYIIVLYTKNGAIVIKSKEENFMHLIGAQHSPLLQNKPRPKVFNKKINNGTYDLFSIVSEENFKNNELTIDEYNICNKNWYFQEIFNYLIDQKVNLYVYIKKTGAKQDSFDCDYLHFAYKDSSGLYLGITGDDKSDYHVFSSIIVEKDNPNKYLSETRIKVTRVEFIEASQFVEKNYVFVPSRRNVS